MENRQDYIEVLQQADRNNLEPFVEFITKELIVTLEDIINNIQGFNSK